MAVVVTEYMDKTLLFNKNFFPICSYVFYKKKNKLTIAKLWILDQLSEKTVFAEIKLKNRTSWWL